MGVEDADEEARDEFMPSVVVGEEPELNGGCTSHVWGWQKGLDNCGDKVDQIPAESMDQRRHGTLRSVPLQHGNPGG